MIEDFDRQVPLDMGFLKPFKSYYKDLSFKAILDYTLFMESTRTLTDSSIFTLMHFEMCLVFVHYCESISQAPFTLHQSSGHQTTYSHNL